MGSTREILSRLFRFFCYYRQQESRKWEIACINHIRRAQPQQSGRGQEARKYSAPHCT